MTFLIMSAFKGTKAETIKALMWTLAMDTLIIAFVTLV